jgi:hypothetical protein
MSGPHISCLDMARDSYHLMICACHEEAHGYQSADT